MHCYESSTQRVALGIAAVAMTAITIGVLVVMPARMQSDAHEPNVLAASTVPTTESTSAATGATTDVVVVHGLGLATAPCPQSKASNTQL